MAHVRHRPVVVSIIPLLVLLASSHCLPWTNPPILPGRHFMLMWNAPTELCDIRFGMPLDLSYFGLVSSTLKTATNQSISIFYTDRFGLFPYMNEDTGEMYDEGLPQLIDFQEHRELAEDDIEYYIPSDLPGLAVLDFEEWRPQWSRNWGSKDIYRQISIETVMKKNASLSDNEAEDRAKVVFERAARGYFLKSIRIGKRLRSNRLWGYYLYPDCYNYDYNQDMEGFTGECPDIEKSRNDELMWLWRDSTALFPSIYLELVLRDSLQARMYVRHRIREAIRVSSLPNSSYSIPIYAYIRPVYKDSVDDYMSEFDLVSTIGEAAALGAAGVISWGDMNVTDTEENATAAHVETSLSLPASPRLILRAGINPERGTKTSHGKMVSKKTGKIVQKKLQTVNAHVSTLIKNLMDFEWHFIKDSCFDARRHLERVMNPYILNVSTATRLCSEALCQGQGRCVRKHWDDNVFLHLDPYRYRIEQKNRGGPLSVIGGLSQADVYWFDLHFDCMCYSSQPCRSVRTFNILQEFVVTTRNGGYYRQHPLLVTAVLLCLKYLLM